MTRPCRFISEVASILRPAKFTLRTTVLASVLVWLHRIDQPFVAIGIGQRLLGRSHVGIAQVRRHAKWLVAATGMSVGSQRCVRPFMRQSHGSAIVIRFVRVEVTQFEPHRRVTGTGCVHKVSKETGRAPLKSARGPKLFGEILVHAATYFEAVFQKYAECHSVRRGIPGTGQVQPSKAALDPVILPLWHGEWG